MVAQMVGMTQHEAGHALGHGGAWPAHRTAPDHRQPFVGGDGMGSNGQRGEEAVKHGEVHGVLAGGIGHKEVVQFVEFGFAQGCGLLHEGRLYVEALSGQLLCAIRSTMAGEARREVARRGLNAGWDRGQLVGLCCRPNGTR